MLVEFSLTELKLLKAHINFKNQGVFSSSLGALLYKLHVIIQAAEANEGNCLIAKQAK